MSSKPAVKLALIDDHTLFRKGLLSLIEGLRRPYQVLFEAGNCRQLQQTIDKDNLPDIVLLGVTGNAGNESFTCAEWLKKSFPPVKNLLPGITEEKDSIGELIIKFSAQGYLQKTVDPDGLHRTLQTIMKRGSYPTDFITGKFNSYAR